MRSIGTPAIMCQMSMASSSSPRTVTPSFSSGKPYSPVGHRPGQELPRQRDRPGLEVRRRSCPPSGRTRRGAWSARPPRCPAFVRTHFCTLVARRVGRRRPGRGVRLEQHHAGVDERRRRGRRGAGSRWGRGVLPAWRRSRGIADGSRRSPYRPVMRSAFLEVAGFVTGAETSPQGGRPLVTSCAVPVSRRPSRRALTSCNRPSPSAVFPANLLVVCAATWPRPSGPSSWRARLPACPCGRRPRRPRARPPSRRSSWTEP